MTGATRVELLRALASVAGPAADPEVCRLLGLPAPPGAAVHTDVFVVETHPYASVHLGPQGMIGGEAADRVAGFWRALGTVPPPGADELGTLLGLYVRLGEEEQAQSGRRQAAIASARAGLLWEHLASWVPVHLASVGRVGGPFYQAWAELLAEALAAEAGALPTRAELPVALADAPPPLDTSSRQDLLTGALAPVRSGMVVTRADLVRAGEELGLGVRRGERRFALEALLDQEPAATLAWLGRLAGEWVDEHRRSHPGALAPIGRWWTDRAAAGATVLAEAAARVAAASPR